MELGRDNFGILVSDGRISRHHARVSFKDGSFFVMDLGSLNGTEVDGQLAMPLLDQPLKQCLRVGDTLLLPVANLVPFRFNAG